MSEKPVMVLLQVEGLALDQDNSPVVLLRETSGKRAVPIWIGHSEAYAISLELEGKKAPRPLTHDLLRDALEQLGARVVSVIIADAHDNTYFARMVLQPAEGPEKELDCRPSDGIAIALRMGAPILISEQLLARIEHERSQREEQEKGRIVMDSGGTVH